MLIFTLLMTGEHVGDTQWRGSLVKGSITKAGSVFTSKHCFPEKNVTHLILLKTLPLPLPDIWIPALKIYLVNVI